MSDRQRPPGADVFEVTLIGPGYGETVIVHPGQGKWIVVDSCEDETGHPQALRYLADIGVGPEAVVLIVASHWHDDHIRGMGQLVEMCHSAVFVCANVLTEREFLKAAYGLETRHLSTVRSGLGEMHTVFSTLRETKRIAFAGINRRIYSTNEFAIWSLSPSDAMFLDFLRSVHSRARAEQRKNRMPVIQPNRASVAVWIAADKDVALLGGDLEKGEWMPIVRSVARPAGKASVFKVPHHGSPTADEPRIWDEMLESNPWAILTPWNRGAGSRPTNEDARRMLSRTRRAYATAAPGLPSRRGKARQAAIKRTVADMRADVRRVVSPAGTVRLRKTIGTTGDWKVELFDGACHLRSYVE